MYSAELRIRKGMLLSPFPFPSFSSLPRFLRLFLPFLLLLCFFATQTNLPSSFVPWLLMNTATRAVPALVPLANGWA